MGFPSFGPGNVAVFLDNSGASLLVRIGTKLQKSDDGGVTYGDLGATVASGSGLLLRSDLATFRPGNVLRFIDNSGASLVSRIAGKLQKSDDGGVTYGDLGSSVATGSAAPPPGGNVDTPARRASNFHE